MDEDDREPSAVIAVVCFSAMLALLALGALLRWCA
jgi:hypothetical protein